MMYWTKHTHLSSSCVDRDIEHRRLLCDRHALHPPLHARTRLRARQWPALPSPHPVTCQMLRFIVALTAALVAAPSAAASSCGSQGLSDGASGDVGITSNCKLDETVVVAGSSLHVFGSSSTSLVNIQAPLNADSFPPFTLRSSRHFQVEQSGILMLEALVLEGGRIKITFVNGGIERMDQFSPQPMDQSWGGISVVDGGNLLAQNIVIHNCTRIAGGALSVTSGSSSAAVSHVNIISSTFSENQAVQWGGCHFRRGSR